MIISVINLIKIILSVKINLIKVKPHQIIISGFVDLPKVFDTLNIMVFF